MSKKSASREAALPFLETLRSTPASARQSRLLNTTDRDLGAVLHALTDEERAEVLGIVGEKKAQRLKEEIARMDHVSLDATTISAIASHLASHLSSDRPLGPASRYFRPKT
jgi:flagellar motor switch protein FliG